MTTINKYSNLSELLSKHNAKDNPDLRITHTRIGSQELNIYAGKYSINKEELSTFYRVYYEQVFVKKCKEYLTEKQLENNGPILIDLDFRYDYDVTTRQHDETHIQDIILGYLEELKKILVFEKDKPFPIFIMEKPNVNRVIDKQVTKDGIHIIIGIQMDHILQQILRERMIEKFTNEIELNLPLKNDWSNILDQGISSGTTNWQMYGSQKPGNEAYKLTYYMIAELDTNDNEWMTTAKNIREIDLSKDLCLLSAQYDKHLKFEMNPDILNEYTNKLEHKSSKKSNSNKGKINLVFQEEEDNDDTYELNDIKNYSILEKITNKIMSSLKPNERFIEEIHRYTQILPEKYYEPGSHLLNRKVAFALKHTDERLFLSWIMLRSKASDFDYNSIPKLYHEWKHNFKHKQDGLTKRSIMYWAKQDAYDEYEKVKRTTIDNYIEETIYEAGDWDYAMVLYHMFKDKYVCSSISNKKWYVFRKHRWEKDEGQSLRLAISKDLFQLYSDKQSEYLSESQNYEASTEIHDKIQRKVRKISEIGVKLKKTNDKNNIMREAMEIFYDKDFIRQMDSNPYLMCFSNGVVDFKNKTFRDGYPHDYITKSTGIPFYHYESLIKDEQNLQISENIMTFMEQLFPRHNLCRYMWDHLASTLIGIKKEQVFNIYRGSGSNGKSLLTDLMSQCLGDYKGTVPITLVTEKRNSIGGTSSEVIQLKGVRYAVMQEPSKEAIINEGIMKELTGGDPIQARALYSESEIFIPQFSLVVCTNALFEIKSNDDGTWRRLKLVDFMSKFISEDETHTDDTQYVFIKDKSLKEKLPEWSVVFISMLVKRAFETDGEVLDCEEVLAASNKYRQNQDCITGFINDKIIKVNGASLGKKVLNDCFKEWFQMNYGNRKIPKLMELEEIINKKFGPKNIKTNKWMNIKIKPDEDEDEDDNISEEVITPTEKKNETKTT
jgi:P4 family phage/plasmid primase-like protien